jgi:hypothetical protein
MSTSSAWRVTLRTTMTPTWSGAAAYDLERGPASAGPWTQVALRVAALSSVDATAPANATLYYRVRAVNAEGLGGAWSAARSIVSAVDPAVAPPAAPAAPTFASVAVATLTVRWVADPAVTSWRVERAPDANGVAGVFAQVATGVTLASWSDSARVGNTAYWYRVRGSSAGGDGAFSPAARVVTLPNAPGAPTFTLLGANGVTVGWTAPTGGAASYAVERAPSSAGPWTAIGTTTALSFADAGLAPLTTYWYRVRALNAEGAPGAWAAARSTKTLAATVASAP